MQTTSELYRAILADPQHLKQHRVFIAGTEYGHGEILSGVETAQTWWVNKPEVTGGLFAKGKTAVGCTVSRQLDIMVMPKGIIPRMAEIRLETRLIIKNLLTGEITQSSEWLPKGTFFIDTRQADTASGALLIHGYDAMLKAEQQYIPTGSESASWPRRMPAMVEDICYRMGVELDERSVIHDWEIQYPADLSMREILSYIAACHVGNFTITDAGKLRLVPLAGTGEAVDIGSAAAGLKMAPAFEPFSGVQFYYDGKDTFAAGDDSGRVLEIEAAWATQEIADAALAAVSGYAYQPYEAAGAVLDPAAELGDRVRVGGVEGLLAAMTTTFDALCAADIAAPSDQEVDHEYPYEDRSLRQTRREVAKATAAIRVGVDEIEARVEDAENNYSSIKQTVDGITLEVTEQAGADGEVYAKIELGIGPNKYSGFIKMTGNLQVDGQLSADALYAVRGDIADLTVNRLSTSRRVVRYLAKDLTDDDYIRIEGERIEFVTAHTDGSTEQATIPGGLKIYWEADISGASRGADGYPYIDAQRIFTTTAVTPWPVWVYKYTEQVKRSTHFMPIDGITSVIETFGAGNAAGNNIGHIVKDAEGLKFMYRDTTGKDIGIMMSVSGFLDLFGLRRTSFLDFSEVPFGKLYETVDGIDREYSYTINRDSKGRVVQIVDDLDSHVCQVKWWD
jgi:hypothetical protein